MDNIVRVSIEKNFSYPWAEVDNPVELYNHAGFAFLETKLAIFDPGAGSQQAPRETAGLPDTHIALQVPSVLVLRRLL